MRTLIITGLAATLALTGCGDQNGASSEDVDPKVEAAELALAACDIYEIPPQDPDGRQTYEERNAEESLLLAQATHLDETWRTLYDANVVLAGPSKYDGLPTNEWRTPEWFVQYGMAMVRREAECSVARAIVEDSKD